MTSNKIQKRKWYNTKFGAVGVVILLLLVYLFFGTILGSTYGAVQGTAVWDLIMIFFCLFLLSSHGLNLNRITSPKLVIQKISKKKKIILVILLTCLILIMYFVGQYTGSVIFYHYKDPAFAQYVKTTRMTQQTMAMYTFISIVIAPICEELLYRGVLYNEIKSKFNFSAALFTQAIVFAALHGTIVHLPGTFLLAVTSALIYEYSGHLYYSVITHIGYNVFALYAGNIHLPKILIQKSIFAVVSYLLILSAVLTMYYMLTKAIKENK